MAFRQYHIRFFSILNSLVFQCSLLMGFVGHGHLELVDWFYKYSGLFCQFPSRDVYAHMIALQMCLWYARVPISHLDKVAFFQKLQQGIQILCSQYSHYKLKNCFFLLTQKKSPTFVVHDMYRQGQSGEYYNEVHILWYFLISFRFN